MGDGRWEKWEMGIVQCTLEVPDLRLGCHPGRWAGLEHSGERRKAKSPKEKIKTKGFGVSRVKGGLFLRFSFKESNGRQKR